MTSTSTRRRPQAPVRRPGAGFTLLELMIAVAVIGILAAIAYPSYTRYVQSARVSDGQAGLMQAAQEMERCYTINNEYRSDCLATTASPDDEYSIELKAEDGGAFSNGSSYALLATADTPNRVSENCDVLWVTHTGEQGSGSEISGDAGDCW